MIVKLKMQRLFRGKMMKIWNRTWTFLHRAQQELYSRKSFILEEGSSYRFWQYPVQQLRI